MILLIVLISGCRIMLIHLSIVLVQQESKLDEQSQVKFEHCFHYSIGFRCYCYPMDFLEVCSSCCLHFRYSNYYYHSWQGLGNHNSF
jgi:hypothetical protein